VPYKLPVYNKTQDNALQKNNIVSYNGSHRYFKAAFIY